MTASERANYGYRASVRADNRRTKALEKLVLMDVRDELLADFEDTRRAETRTTRSGRSAHLWGPTDDSE